MLRSKCAASVAVGLLAGMTALTNPAQALSVAVDLSISYFVSSPLPPQIFPGTTQLSGLASFYIDTLNSPSPLPPQIDIGHLNVGDTFVQTFAPGDPCFAAVSCRLNFSFGGQTSIPGNPITPFFLAAAFPLNVDLGTISAAQGPPIMPLAFFQGGAPLSFSGPIVAFDAPVIVGEWDITIHEATATPLPAALPLFVTGLGALGLVRWRKQKKAAALAA
jgi:hypothetical protein